jgi:putative addiction module killer protein
MCRPGTAGIDRLAMGHPGQHRALHGGVFEMQLDFGSGYRVYCVERGAVVTVLLCEGDKSTQQSDIDLALRLTGQLE